MRVLFCGTPRFAVPSLEAVARAHQVVAVVTQPDRPAGRGLRLVSPPVAVRARELGLPVLQPERLRDVRGALEDACPEVGVVVAYGRILPGWLLQLPPRGFVNLHPSLLPRHRGASPVQAAIRSGDPTTGVSVIRVTEELDAGDVLAQKEVPIYPDDTAGTLESRLAEEGARLLVGVLDAMERGDLRPTPQDPARATYCGKLSKEAGQISWEWPAELVERHVRAMDPWPAAYTLHQGRALKVWRVRLTDGDGAPGEVLRLTPQGFVVATGRGAVEVLEVQPASGRRMTAAEYARGYRLKAGDRLG
ncbi:MAG: methionyl-tRNA formyltransferase [Armatimonadota bacterium]|nr:methionyl-tRNA formyltransferase [Armatimonadota bacterium]MDW8156893.1 methionyl-tRNA formyltransferase [Armatimonadota bacterium]